MRNDKIFTPQRIVEVMLDMIGYKSDNEEILNKYIIDNSCGDGAFLKEIVRRYIRAYINKYGIENGQTSLIEGLDEHIIGVEIDGDLCDKTVDNLDAVYEEEMGKPQYEINWSVYHTDALSKDVEDMFYGKFDYVVGNPPYINVHDMDDSTYDNLSKLSFCKKGMKDLYIAFFELGFRMLNDNGKLCYITPSSWKDSVSASEMRKYVHDNNMLTEIFDFGHEQVFEDVNTYVMISLFDKKNNKDKITVHPYKSEYRCGIFELDKDDCFVNGKYYFNDGFKHIINYNGPKFVSVKNGFATLNDSYFIGDAVKDIDENYLIDVYKCNSGTFNKAFFPYDKVTGNPIEFDILTMNTSVKKYLEKNYNKLSKNGKIDNYWQYGRTQGIKDIGKQKFGISNIVKDTDKIHCSYIDDGVGVYSGLYVVSNSNENLMDKVNEIVHYPDFMNYVKFLGKYKSGGYYTFSSKELENYLNFNIGIIFETDYPQKYP